MKLIPWAPFLLLFTSLAPSFFKLYIYGDTPNKIDWMREGLRIAGNEDVCAAFVSAMHVGFCDDE